MSHEFQPQARRRSPFPQEQGFADYYGIGSPTPKAQRGSATSKSSREKSPRTPNIALNFQIGDRSVEAYYPQGRRFGQLSMDEKILLAIGQSNTFPQTPEAQIEFMQALAGKADEDQETPFEDRFNESLNREIEEGRVIAGNNGHLQLTAESLPVIDEAIKRTKAAQRFTS